MKKYISFLLIIGIIIFLPFTRVSAFEITSDPQFVVMNFSEINELDWAAPEDVWTREVKPKIVSQIHDLKKALPLGTPERRLAWSTLMEYMNFPMDTPGPNSIYIVKLRRILEITEAENIPVYIPLNGYQWWDELPELYNWWDPDGTHTPKQFFTRQDTKDFKERFIKGYNPDNIWNVEWENYTEPMNVNWRNWGGGAFVLAPPPNLMHHDHTKLTYRMVMEARFTALINELVTVLRRWEAQGKQDLLAGISIGTEVSVHASLNSDDYSAYGYRGLQDLLCEKNNPLCGTELKLSADDLKVKRQQIVRGYFDAIAPIAVRRGIPKQRLYTHVGEFAPGDDHYFPYAPSAFTLYARPGTSLYAFAQNPYDHPDWMDAMKKNGFPNWGAVEYSTFKTEADWVRGITAVFSPDVKPANILTIYNWDQHHNTDAMPGIAAMLKKTVVVQDCDLPEVIPTIPYGVYDPVLLTWKYLGDNPERTSNMSFTVHIVKGPHANLESQSIDVPAGVSREIPVPHDLMGLLTWYVEVDGCKDMRSYSEPRLIVVTPKFAEYKTPWWVRLIMYSADRLDRLSSPLQK